MTDRQVFEAGDVALQSGAVFPGMRLSYRTYGTLSPAKDNAILYPTSFGAQHQEIDWLVQPDGVLDPERYFVVIADLFGNGLSSSPSNTAGYVPVTYHDAVAIQRRLLVEHFGISRLALVYGWSMGGMQAYHWAAGQADMVERVAVVCGSARCSPYNHIFLEGAKAALTADPAFQDGRFVTQPVTGLRAMGRVYAGWALSHGFYRDELWREGGFTSVEDFLQRSWDTNFAKRDADDLLAQIAIWQAGDISACAEFGGDMDQALSAVKAHLLLMPGSTDRYFDWRDNEADLPKLVNAASVTFRPIPSDYGHRAGNPVANPADRAFLKAEVAALLAR
jgi:homoserine O-acetyltransferase